MGCYSYISCDDMFRSYLDMWAYYVNYNLGVASHKKAAATQRGKTARRWLLRAAIVLQRNCSRGYKNPSRGQQLFFWRAQKKIQQLGFKNLILVILAHQSQTTIHPCRRPPRRRLRGGFGLGPIRLGF